MSNTIPYTDQVNENSRKKRWYVWCEFFTECMKMPGNKQADCVNFITD